ncbi:hypothetical protein ACC691_36425, partial [Rhizobium johnstonii]|uniref:hypothetical protein n=1 Tax=Rhizobium johnstonii TaxID=3019933 RepID=UPI003F95C5F0
MYTGTGLVAAAEVETLDAMHAPPRLSVWFPLHADAVAIDQASVLEEQLRKQSSTTTGIVIERP